MPKVIIMQGCPYSGKTTKAKEIMLEDNSYVRVNRDDIRSMLYNYGWSREVELLVKTIELDCIENALRYKKNVIIDSTNLQESRLNDFYELFNRLSPIVGKIDYEIMIFDVDLDTLLNRRETRIDNVVNLDDLLRMYNKFQEYLKQE